MTAQLPAMRRLRCRLVQRARRLVSCPAAADDLVQDALLAALLSGRDWQNQATERWLFGVLRRRAAFVHRTATRQRTREQHYAANQALDGVPVLTSSAPLPDLPPSLHMVAKLAAAGCTRDEIQWVLGLAPTALRQRISAAGRRLRGTGAPACAVPTVATGPVRQTVLPLSRRTGDLGTHDPDGHAILVGRSQYLPPRQPKG